jgi:predicted nucleic acid-binding protein
MTKGSADIVYWDACAWIAYIQKEMPGPGSTFTEPRYNMCRRVLERAAARQIDIATSAYTLSEVCKVPADATSPARNLPAFFDQPYIVLVNVDKQVGLKAQSLQVAGVVGLKPQDATHVASALVWNIPTLHTFDEKLLNLDKVLTLNDGNQLRIIQPSSDDPPDMFTHGITQNA